MASEDVGKVVGVVRMGVPMEARPLIRVVWKEGSLLAPLLAPRLAVGEVGGF